METEFDLQRTGKIALSYDSSKSCKSPLHFKLVRVSYLNDHYASKLYQCSICLCLGVVSGNANAEKKKSSCWLECRGKLIPCHDTKRLIDWLIDINTTIHSSNYVTICLKLKVQQALSQVDKHEHSFEVTLRFELFFRKCIKIKE